MALLVDGGWNTVEDLRAQDSGVTAVAHGEGIDLVSKLEVARQEIEMEIGRALRRSGCGRIEQVVATAEIKRWQVLATLAMIYRDAYFSQMNDRYGKRWEAYDADAKRAASRVLDGGIGMVAQPLRRPRGVKATLEAGTQSAASYWIQTSWTGAGGESAPSEAVVVNAANGHQLKVEQGEAPENATGWNVYVGLSEDSTGRQNAQPLAVGAAWTAGAEIQSGTAAGEGQQPEYYCERRRLLKRG